MSDTNSQDLDTTKNSGSSDGEGAADNSVRPIKQIKLVISDLHLGKGKLLPGGGINALEEFYYGDKLVEFINYYSTGLYRDYQIELIINGDFLNFLQCDFRGHFLTVLTEKVCLEILQEIVRGHSQVFKALSDFAAKTGNSVTYVCGNHDQAMLWPACREYLNHIIGTPVRYKNLVYFFDGFHIEHGHMHEAANRFDPRRFFLKKDLAEPILNLPFGSHFFVEFVLKVKHRWPVIDKIRPFSKMVRWSLINETWFSVSTLAHLWVYFFRTAVRKDPRRRWSLKSLVQIVLESAIFPDLGEAARKVLSDDRVHTVIFGHNHVYQYRQWTEDKEYFNTGTWTELTSLDIVSLGKLTKLTFVLIEYPESGARPRGRLKEWKGYHRIEEDVAVS